MARSTLAFRDGNLIRVDRDPFCFAQPGSGEDALHDLVLSSAVLVDVDCRRCHSPLHVGIFVTQLRLTPQQVPESEMIPLARETRRPRHTCSCRRGGRAPRTPTVQDAQFSTWLETETVQRRGRRRDLTGVDDDVAVDDRLRGKPRNGGASDMLVARYRTWAASSAAAYSARRRSKRSAQAGSYSQTSITRSQPATYVY